MGYILEQDRAAHYHTGVEDVIKHLKVLQPNPETIAGFPVVTDYGIWIEGCTVIEVTEQESDDIFSDEAWEYKEYHDSGWLVADGRCSESSGKYYILLGNYSEGRSNVHA